MNIRGRIRRSAIVRAIYHSKATVLAHRFLSSVGFHGLLGLELSDMARLREVELLASSLKSSKKRVLFVIPRNWTTHVVFQLGVAQALTLRGAECAIVTCGGVMPVCAVTWAERELFPRCPRCTAYVNDAAELAGIKSYNIAEEIDGFRGPTFLSETESLTLRELTEYVWNGLPLGRYAIPATRWRLRSDDISRHPDGQAVLSGFIRSGARWASGMERVLESFKPDVLVMLNGLFMEERVSWTLVQKQGRRSVFFERGRDAGTVFLSHEQSATRYDISESWERVGNIPLTTEERKNISEVMERRVRGEQLIETYWAVKESDQEKICRRLKLDRKTPVALLFTNVSWDTAMQDRDTIFDGMMDWLRYTIDIFRLHPEWALVIRIHPAETQVAGRESFERVGEWITQEFRPLPGNIRVVLPDVPIDSYVLMSLARLGLVYASTTGLEMAVTEVPVVVAGGAHYAGKGFTYDPSRREEYRKQVELLMQGDRSIPRAEQVELALRYAHLFFLRRMFPMTVLEEPVYARPRLAYESLGELVPGHRKVLDVICDGIMNGTEFELSRTVQ